MEKLAEEYADFGDPKWHSGVGAEVLEEYMQQKMTLSRILGSESGHTTSRACTTAHSDEIAFCMSRLSEVSPTTHFHLLYK
jgi:hypothetical protein